MENKTCTDCEETKLLTEYYKKGNTHHTYCKSCLNKRTIERQRKLKERAVEYKGGSCIDCGYSKCIAALEFHHTDPSTKEGRLSQMLRKKAWDKVKKELDKCVLVCSNCHKERHFKGH